MYRPRVKVRTGCLRCKVRRKKCDERQPICSFCKRWNLDCVWPQRKSAVVSEVSKRAHCPSRCVENETMVSTVICRPSDGYEQLCSNLNTSTFDPFHDLPIHEHGNSHKITGALRSFFTGMLTGAMPFDISKVQQALAHGWARSMFADVAVCYALAAYAFHNRSHNRTGSTDAHLALAYENRALMYLQTYLQGTKWRSEGALLAATLHWASFAYSSPSAAELCRIRDGIGVMVEAHGGYLSLLRSMQPSTILSVEICDIFVSFMTATRPLYTSLVKPRQPPSLESLCKDTASLDLFKSKFPGTVISVIEDLRFILFFRKPSKQERALSSDEAFHLFQLLRSVDARLGVLQAEYVGTSSLTEIVVTALVVLKLEVIAEAVQQISLVQAVLGRLRFAISAVGFCHGKLDQEILLWACLVGLVGTGLQTERKPILVFAVRFLKHMLYVSNQSEYLKRNLNARLSQLLWHERLQKVYDRICKTLEAEINGTAVTHY